jgi:hypothetical protein
VRARSRGFSGERPPRPHGLGRKELKPVLRTLERLADSQDAVNQVDVLPSQAERFAPTQADAEGDGVERVQAIVACSLEQSFGVLNSDTRTGRRSPVSELSRAVTQAFPDIRTVLR